MQNISRKTIFLARMYFNNTAILIFLEGSPQDHLSNKIHDLEDWVIKKRFSAKKSIKFYSVYHMFFSKDSSINIHNFLPECPWKILLKIHVFFSYYGVFEKIHYVFRKNFRDSWNNIFFKYPQFLSIIQLIKFY